MLGGLTVKHRCPQDGRFLSAHSQSPSWSSQQTGGRIRRSFTPFPALIAWKVHMVLNYIRLCDILATAAEIVTDYSIFCEFGVVPAARQHCFKWSPFPGSSPRAPAIHLQQDRWVTLLPKSSEDLGWAGRSEVLRQARRAAAALLGASQPVSWRNSTTTSLVSLTSILLV